MNLKRKLPLLTCALLLAIMPIARAVGTKPTPLKAGTTANVTLDDGDSKDYAVSLSKGTYRLVWDSRRTDGEWGNIQGVVSLLKPNGAIIDASLLRFNELAAEYRVGRTITVTKPYVARFRMKSEKDGIESWFTVLPVAPSAPIEFIPFGWGAKVTPARISSDNGVGGVIEKNESFYHSITLPKGKWSISLGLSQTGDESTNLQGKIDLLDVHGFAKVQTFVRVNEIDRQARQETVLAVTKPTMYLLRVNNDSSGYTYNYDVTIEPAG